MRLFLKPMSLLTALLAVFVLGSLELRADDVSPKSNLKGKIEETEWVNQEMKTKQGGTIPEGLIVLTFKKDYSFTFEIKGSSTGKGKVQLKEKDAISLNFDEEFNGRKVHEETITIDKDVLTLIDTDGTTLKFDRVKPKGGLLSSVTPKEVESNLRGKIEGTKWTSQAQDLKEGKTLPAGILKLEFNKDMTFTYKAGDMTWTGKYELMKGDVVKLISDQDLGGKKVNVETLIIKGDTLKMTDPDGTTIMFDTLKAGAPKDKPGVSKLKGKIEGTEWKSQAAKIKGTEIPAGTLTLKFGKDMSLVYTAGPQKWTGKFELFGDDQVKLLTEQDLGGRKENIEKIVIEKDVLTMTDTDGTELAFDRVTDKPEPKGPKEKGVSNLKGKIEGTKWKSLKATIMGNDIPAGAISIDFNANMTFTYRAGPMTWTGKYVLLEGDGLKLLSDQDLGGTKENYEKIVIDKNNLTMTDPNGTQLKFEKAPSDD